jgi:hypothetical protein
VSRIWRTFELKPHRVDTFKLFAAFNTAPPPAKLFN